MTNGTSPPTLAGCEVLPPMEPPPEGPPPARRSKTPSNGGRDRPKGKSGRFAILNTFLDFTLATLGRNEIAVWLLLYRDTKPEGTARTSIADLARRAGVSKRTALRNVAALERRGLLRIVHRGGLNRGLSIYRVLPLVRESTGDKAVSP